MTAAVRQSALLRCPTWCDGRHKDDDVEGNGYRFHEGATMSLESDGTDQRVWTDGYELEVQLTRYDNHESGIVPTADTRIRVQGLNAVDCTPETLRTMAAWLSERADDLERVSVEH